MIADIIAKDWIHPSVSIYGALILFMCKKTGELCMCVDFQALNSNTLFEIFPLPCVSDLLDWLGCATVFSNINLAHAY